MKLSKRFYPSILLTFLLMVVMVSCFDNPPGPGTGNNEDEYSHKRSPGLSANDFLSDSTFKNLVIEIDYMRNYVPNAEALDSLLAFLSQRLNKTNITILEPEQIPSRGQSSYTVSEVRNLESSHRDHYSDEETLAAYMIILDGYYSQNNVLGVAHYNTSTSYFGTAMDDAGSGFGAPTRYQLESTTFRHEFGHLFGLVDVPDSGTEMQTDHKDEENGNHCTNDSCLMYYALGRSDLIRQLFLQEVPSLDANCLADLKANGGR